VHRSRPAGVLPPRSHMLLRIDLAEGPYIADVGFGTAVTAPLALAAWREQATPHELFRLVPADDEFDLQVRFAGTWTDLYRLSLHEQMPVDYEAMNWYTSTYPESLFVRNLIATRPAAGCRRTLFNDKFTIRHCDGKAERRTLRDDAEFGEVLDRYFGIALPDPAEIGIMAALARERAAHPDFFDHS
jgi:N-hydroxyarylamine O-acetyltransferase